jgi:DeoR/GlpR family transcriptional regulator of sugar metabolism
VLEVAYHLRDRRDLTVITNSVPVMEILKAAPGIMLIGLGGILRRPLQAYIGHITEQALAELHADKVIMGVRAIDVDEGLTNDDPICTQTDRAMLAVGKQAIIVADFSKCRRVATAFVAPLAAVHTLVTDANAPPDFVSELSARGIRVVIA